MATRVRTALLDLKDAARDLNTSARQAARHYLGSHRGIARMEWTAIALIVLVTLTLLVTTLGSQLMDQITALFTTLL